MSREKKREPMLNDGDAGDIAWAAYATTSSPEVGGIAVRDYYERLIDEGKLRVAEEVEFRNNDYDCYITCSGCHDGVPYYVWDEMPDGMSLHCPGCGSKIKR